MFAFCMLIFYLEILLSCLTNYKSVFVDSFGNNVYRIVAGANNSFSSFPILSVFFSFFFSFLLAL